MGKESRLIVTLLLLMGITAFAINSGRAEQAIPNVSERLAHTLAKSTLTANAQHLPGMRFDREIAPHPPDFYWFEITAKVPDQVSPLLGYFAVNKMTGDVWNFTQCKKLTSLVIRKLQDELRKEGKISTQDFEHFSREAPCEP